MKNVGVVALAFLLTVSANASAENEPLVTGPLKWEELGVEAFQNCTQTQAEPDMVVCEPRKTVYYPVRSIGYYQDGAYVEVMTIRQKGELKRLTEEEARAEGMLPQQP